MRKQGSSTEFSHSLWPKLGILTLHRPLPLQELPASLSSWHFNTHLLSQGGVKYFPRVGFKKKFGLLHLRPHLQERLEEIRGPKLWAWPTFSLSFLKTVFLSFFSRRVK